MRARCGGLRGPWLLTPADSASYQVRRLMRLPSAQSVSTSGFRPLAEIHKWAAGSRLCSSTVTKAGGWRGSAVHGLALPRLVTVSSPFRPLRGRVARRTFSTESAPGAASPPAEMPALPVRPPRVELKHTADTVAIVFRRKTFYMIITGIAVFAFLTLTDFTSWVYHYLHKDELEAHWAGRVYDESYQLLLKRSKRSLLEKRKFLATEAEREALARGDFRTARVSPRHSFLNWRYRVAKDGSVKHTFKLWKFDVEVDVEYPLLVGTQYVGDLRAQGLLGMEDMHLTAAEIVPRTGQAPILLTKREKEPSFELGFTAYPPHLSLPEKWGVGGQ